MQEENYEIGRNEITGKTLLLRFKVFSTLMLYFLRCFTMAKMDKAAKFKAKLGGNVKEPDGPLFRLIDVVPCGPRLKSTLVAFTDEVTMPVGPSQENEV